MEHLIENKITINKQKLLHMVNAASLLANKKSTEILFTCLTISIEDDNITVQSTNGISCCVIQNNLQLQQKQNWQFMINSTNFLKILKQLDDQFITIEKNIKRNVIVIQNQTGSDYFELAQIAHKNNINFPRSSRPLCKIQANVLKNLIDKTSLNVMEDRGGNIALVLQDKKAKIITYDNTRISWSESDEDIIECQDKESYVNNKTHENDLQKCKLSLQIHMDIPCRQYLYKILLSNKDLDYDIDLGYSDCKKFIYYKCNNTTLFCKIINKSLLDYYGFTHMHNQFITIDTKEFIKNLQKVSVIISEINYAVTLTAKPNQELLIFSNNPANGAQSSITMQYIDNTIDSFVKLNIKYLLEALKTIKQKTFLVSILSHNKPIYIKTSNTNHIMMPIAYIE